MYLSKCPLKVDQSAEICNFCTTKMIVIVFFQWQWLFVKSVVSWLLLFICLSICAPGARIEEFLYEKLDRKVPPRPTNGEILGQFMLEAAKEFGSGTPYGKNPDSETYLTMFLLSHVFFLSVL